MYSSHLYRCRTATIRVGEEGGGKEMEVEGEGEEDEEDERNTCIAAICTGVGQQLYVWGEV